MKGRIVVALLPILCVAVAILYPVVQKPKSSVKKLMDPVTRKLTDDIEAKFQRGVKLEKEGRYLEAEGLFREVLDKKPFDDYVRRSLAMLLEKRKRPREALQEYVAITTPADNHGSTLTRDPAMLWKVSELAKQAGDEPLAEKTLEQILLVGRDQIGSRYPAVPRRGRSAAERAAYAYLMLGNASSARMDRRSALDHYQRAFDLLPTSSLTLAYLGYGLKWSHRYGEARDILSKARTAFPAGSVGRRFVDAELASTPRGVRQPAEQETLAKDDRA